MSESSEQIDIPELTGDDLAVQCLCDCVDDWSRDASAAVLTLIAAPLMNYGKHDIVAQFASKIAEDEGISLKALLKRHGLNLFVATK